MRKCFLPPSIHSRIPGAPVEREQRIRVQRTFRTALSPGGIQVYTAQNREVEPGTRLPDLSDPRAKEANTGLVAMFKLLATVGDATFDQGCVATVHYGRDYDNAFWDGQQMVFGDGDRRYFNPFTIDLDIAAHELGHGVTGDLLNYEGQSGALNESISDCYGAVSRQLALGLSLDDPTAWLIGAKLFTPRVSGVALRHMLHPGTAYKDATLGKDDQPADMSGYFNTTGDNGGVHTNSGIPNRAFALASIALGSSVDALRIWRGALHSVNDPDCTFAHFAQATVDHSSAKEDALKIRDAWNTVGIAVAVGSPSPSPQPSTDGPFPGADAIVGKRILAAAHRLGMTPSDWMNHHFHTYFRV